MLTDNADADLPDVPACGVVPHFGHVLEHGDPKRPTRFLLAYGVETVFAGHAGGNLFAQVKSYFLNLVACLLCNQLGQTKAEREPVKLFAIGDGPGFVKSAATEAAHSGSCGWEVTSNLGHDLGY